MEENLQEELSVNLHLRKTKMLLKRQVLKVILHVLALTVSEILTFTIIYLEKVGQGH